jgi:AraC-like DNA-binding protein
VNEYRIKEAIRLIENTPRENKNLYIDGLYQEVGFNSPAPFFRTFKQITGLSPCTFFRQIDNGKE